MKKVVNLLLLVIFLIFPFGQLFRLHFSILSILSILGWGGVHFLDLLVGVLVAAWSGWQVIHRRKIKPPPGSKFIFAFILIALLSWLVNFKNYTQLEQIVALLYLVRWTAYAGLYFLIFNFNFSFFIFHFSFKPSTLLLTVGTLSAIFGLLQYLFFPDVRVLTALGWDPHYYRVVGTFFDPGFAGLIYALGLILLISQYYEDYHFIFRAIALKVTSLKPPEILHPSSASPPAERSGWRTRIKNDAIHYSLFIILFLILYSALALTYSRSAYLAYLVGMSVIAHFKKSGRFLAFILILGTLTIFILPRPGGEGVKLERTSTAWARLKDYQQTIAIIKDHPLLGVGFNFYRSAQKEYRFLGEDWLESRAGAGSSSSLLFVWATTGIFGLIAYLALLGSLLKKAHSLLKRHRQRQHDELSSAVFASLAAAIIHSFFNHSLFYPWIMLWLWVILGEAFKKAGSY